MSTMMQLLLTAGKHNVTFYPEYDFIPVLEPDPPYVRVPPPNEKFLANNFTPVFKTHTCPFCQSKVASTPLGKKTWDSRMQPVFQEWRVITEDGDVTLYVCPSCSWWAVLETTLGRQVIEEKNYASLIDIVSVHWAKMKTFDVNTTEASVNYLRTCLSQHAKETSQNSQNDLINLIQACFDEFYDCDIVQVGEAKTDSYETFLVRSDNPLLIRVKRKFLADNDSVQVIHDVLGVKITNNQFAGLLISPTTRFSEDLERTAMLPVILNEAILIPLNNYEAVLEIVKRPVDDSAKPWDAIWR